MQKTNKPGLGSALLHAGLDLMSNYGVCVFVIVAWTLSTGPVINILAPAVVASLAAVFMGTGHFFVRDPLREACRAGQMKLPVYYATMAAIGAASAGFGIALWGA